ncbi:MAG: nucleotide pyrophosphohydrolase [Candidatus Gracilibacteria bacterium]|nr:nucleotide pyrophosphohydrolase [Candidatus Gracilibacteria bacterium]
MNIKELQKLVIDFRNDRDWKQFHNPKDIATAISIEAGELQEKFLWKSQADSYEIGNNDVEVGEEIADIFNYLLLLSDACGVDLEQVFLNKIEKNNMKYSVEKSKGKSDKYTKL